MEESRNRPTFDNDFKISTVKIVVEVKQSLSFVVRDLGIAINTNQNWNNKYLKEISPVQDNTTTGPSFHSKQLSRHLSINNIISHKY